MKPSANLRMPFTDRTFPDANCTMNETTSQIGIFVPIESQRCTNGTSETGSKRYDMATLLLFTVPLQLSSACNLM
ncbi:hypothetical protein OUZ56_032181 [Daphnia magna]|uniref:Uncharacterized protein n=1 Tax=Daphnia magna TaxID=35525 RepID=A0ABQ9ZWD7_9CRUS|nr:hypothetical protein OUZ56_032181 [Daphnia magna]